MEKTKSKAGWLAAWFYDEKSDYFTFKKQKSCHYGEIKKWKYICIYIAHETSG